MRGGNMKKLIVAVAALTGISGAAVAADMPTKAPPARVVAYNWSGLYFGAHAGYGWANAHWTTNDHAVNEVELVDQKPRGWVAGGQVGVRVQTGNFVWGIEGTLSATDIVKRDPSCGVGTGPLPCTSPVVTVNPGFREDTITKFQNVATVTGQLGYAWNNALLYAKGGWAFAGYRMENDTLNTA